MIQMASVFGEQERQIIRSRVLAGLDRMRQQGKKLGRPKVPPKIEDAIRTHLRAGHGILKVAALIGVGSGTVQQVRRELLGGKVSGVRVRQGFTRTLPLLGMISATASLRCERGVPYR